MNMKKLQRRALTLPHPIDELNAIMLKKALLLSVFILGMICSLNAQDFHYSQFYNAPLNLNPALTGIFKGDVRAMGNLRSQWHSVPVDYLTVTMAADQQFVRKTAKPGFFSAGIAFNYDKAGYSKLHLVNLGLTGSYTQKLTNTFFTTVGAGLGVGQRAFNTSALTFDRQFDDGRGTYDETLSNGENFSNTSNFYLDFSAGVNFRLQSLQEPALVDLLNKRSRLDFGIGFFHLNTPDQSFLEGDKAPLTMRISPYLTGVVQVGKSFDVVGHFTAQWQKPYSEYLGGLGIRAHIDKRLGHQIALTLGVGYRFNNEFGDGFIPGIELSYNAWEAGFTYDVNVSDFNVATQGRGGPEFSIRYYLRKVRALPFYRVCPLI